MAAVAGTAKALLFRILAGVVVTVVQSIIMGRRTSWIGPPGRSPMAQGGFGGLFHSLWAGYFHPLIIKASSIRIWYSWQSVLERRTWRRRIASATVEKTEGRMTSQAHGFDIVLKRLEKVEGENRFLRRLVLLILLVTGGVLAMGPAVRSLGQGRQSHRIEAEEFVLKDRDGSVRAKLAVSGNTPQLTVYDGTGNPGAAIITQHVSRSDTDVTNVNDASDAMKHTARPGSEMILVRAAGSYSTVAETLRLGLLEPVEVPNSPVEVPDSKPAPRQPPSNSASVDRSMAAEHFSFPTASPPSSWSPSASGGSGVSASERAFDPHESRQLQPSHTAVLSELAAMLREATSAARSALAPSAERATAPETVPATVPARVTATAPPTMTATVNDRLPAEPPPEAVSGETSVEEHTPDELKSNPPIQLDGTRAERFALPGVLLGGDAYGPMPDQQQLDAQPIRSNSTRPDGVSVRVHDAQEASPQLGPVALARDATAIRRRILLQRADTQREIPHAAPVGSLAAGKSSQRLQLAQPSQNPLLEYRAPPVGAATGSASQNPRVTLAPDRASSGAPPTAVPTAQTTATPPIALKVLGYVDKPGIGREVVISDELEVYVAHEGETFAERFKVLKIFSTAVDVVDTYTNQTIRLTFSP